MRTLTAIALVALSIAPLLSADEQPRKITVAANASRVVSGAGISQVAVSDPTVIDVQPISTSEVLGMGLAPGASDLLLWDKFGRHKYKVSVVASKAATDTLAEMIQKRLGVPSVKAEAAGDRIILRGSVESSDEQKRVEAIAKALYPNVDSVLAVNPALLPAVIADIRNSLAPYALEASLGDDGTVIVKGSMEGPAALDTARNCLAQWAKQVRFVFDVQMKKTAQQEAVDTLNLALSRWSIKASALPDGRVLAEGSVPDKDALASINAIVEDWPKHVRIVPRIVVADDTSARQILIRARVIELDRTDLKDIGVDWSRIVFSGTGEDMKYSASDQPFIIGQGMPGPFPLFGGPPLSQLDPIGARINALLKTNKAHLLSQPSLVTSSGKPASILIGGEIPIPVPQSGIGGTAAITIQYKEFGISLEVLPTIDENNEIAMHVKPEVSDLDYSNAIVISGFVVPAIRTRRAETTVHVASGTSIAIGGLIARDIIKNVKAIPLLSKIPILGNFFKSVSSQNKDSELLIIVTPEFVTVPPVPDLIKREGVDVPSAEPACESRRDPESIGEELSKSECLGKLASP